jgi:hypothetical protein
MKVEEAKEMLLEELENHGFIDSDPVSIEAVRVLLEGYEAAVSDLDISASCDTCKHGPRKSDACKARGVDTKGVGCYVWRGTEPGGEGSK